MSAVAAATPTQIFDADWAARWSGHLTGIIDPAWRPEEYDHAQLMFIPANKRAQLQCVRQGCGEIAVQKSLCTLCRREKWLSGLALDEFCRTLVSRDRSSVSLTTDMT